MSTASDPFDLFDGDDDEDITGPSPEVKTAQEEGGDYCQDLKCYSYMPCLFHTTSHHLLHHHVATSSNIKEDIPSDIRTKLLEAIGSVQRGSGLSQFANFPKEGTEFFSVLSSRLVEIANDEGWELHYRYKLPVLTTNSKTKNAAALRTKVEALPKASTALALLHPFVRRDRSLIGGANFGAFATQRIPKLRRIGMFLGYPTQSSATSSYAYAIDNLFIDPANPATGILLPEFSEVNLGLLNEPSHPYTANCAWYHPSSSASSSSSSSSSSSPTTTTTTATSASSAVASASASSSSSFFYFAECFAARDIEQGEELLWSYGEGYQNYRSYQVDPGAYLAVQKSATTGAFALERANDNAEQPCEVAAEEVEREWHLALQRMRDFVDSCKIQSN